MCSLLSQHSFPYSCTSRPTAGCSWWCLRAPEFNHSLFPVSVLPGLPKGPEAVLQWGQDEPGWTKFWLRLHLGTLSLLIVLKKRFLGAHEGQNRILLCISINQSSTVPTHFGILGTQLSDITTARASLSADNRGCVSWFHINAGFLPHWNRAESYSDRPYITWRLGRR